MIFRQPVQEERLAGRALVDPRDEGVHQVRVLAIDLLWLGEVLQRRSATLKKRKKSATGKRLEYLDAGIPVCFQRW